MMMCPLGSSKKEEEEAKFNGRRGERAEMTKRLSAGIKGLL